MKDFEEFITDSRPNRMRLLVQVLEIVEIKLPHDADAYKKRPDEGTLYQMQVECSGIQWTQSDFQVFLNFDSKPITSYERETFRLFYTPDKYLDVEGEFILFRDDKGDTEITIFDPFVSEVKEKEDKPFGMFS